MTTLADLAKPLSLRFWLGLPADRVRFARRFIAIALTLAAAKVFFNTVAFALFLANEGPAQLPRFYLVLALVAIALSVALGSVVDRMPKLGLARTSFVLIMLTAAAGKFMIAGGLPGAYFIILAAAFIFEIAIEILFWAACAAYVDTTELKRTTPIICLAIAIGGAFGGLVARSLAWTVDTPDLLLFMVAFAGVAIVQFSVPSTFTELPEGHTERAATGEDAPGPWRFARVAIRHPLLLLIALNALALTILYGIAEFLILSVYREHYPEEQELARFLGIVFALLQACEFALLASLSRVLLERATPLVRNLVFPISSLLCFVALAFNNRLGVAVIAHVNAEAASNAVFQPVHNANFLALPLRIQGRARTLSEGVFYPAGLAIAGALLWSLETAGAIAAAEFIAIVFALLFILINIGVGILFLPTLIANLDSGLTRPREISATTMPAPRVRALLESPESELRLFGLRLAHQLGPDGLEDDLLALAAHPDRATRAALGHLIAAAPAPFAQEFLARCVAAEAEEALKLALLVMLIGRSRPTPEQMERALGAHDPAIVALGQIVAKGVDAWPSIEPLVESSRVSSDLVDAIVSAERADLAPLLIRCLPTAQAEPQRRALALLNGSAAGGDDDATRQIVQRLALRRDPAVRAEAIVWQSRTAPPLTAVRLLIAALDDPDIRARQRAAEELCRYGDRATALLRRRLGNLTAASIDAVRVLAQIGSPRSRRVLADYIRRLHEDAERTAQLLEHLAAAPDRASWSALELCLREHRMRMVDAVSVALTRAVDQRLAGRLRTALRGSDRRTRASAFELIAAVPASRLPAGAVALLRLLLFEDGAAAGRARSKGDRLVAEASVSMSPWVRRAAALHSGQASLPQDATAPSAAGAGDRTEAGGGEMTLDDQDFERIIGLKRMPLFRYVPFETIAQVARSAQVRTYPAGQEIIAEGTYWQDLLILEGGALSIGHGGSARSLSAPACFGEMALAGEPMRWPRISALDEARVSFLRAPVFEELCREHPEIALELTRLLARRLREATEPPAMAAD